MIQILAILNCRTAIPTNSTDSINSTGWSPWKKTASCSSGCIRGSMGFYTLERNCLNDSLSCSGFNSDVRLCKDTKICEKEGRKRIAAFEFASERCLNFSSKVDAIDGTAGGSQKDHEPDRVWVGCTVFCRNKDSESFYTPRIQLNKLGIDPYFPDGTWCHKDTEGQNYFCRKHHCLPADFR